MTQEEINSAIAKAIGAEPISVEWWAYKPDETGGRICMSASTKEEVEYWIAEHADFAKGYSPKEFLRYPSYTSDLNAMHSAWQHLTREQKLEYRQHLKEIGVREYLRRQDVWMEEIEAEFGPEAFLKTLNLWQP